MLAAAAAPAAPPPAPYHAAPRRSDVAVVSAEGITLRADRQQLADASTRFRNQLMMDLSLRLPEPAAVLAPFLDVVTGAADLFPVVNNRASVLGALPILRLFARYDCCAALTAALTALKCMVMDHDACPLETFMLGAAVRDVSLCRTAIVHGGEYADLAAVERALRAGGPAALACWAAVPLAYRAALEHAFDAADPKDRGNRFAEDMYLEGEDSADPPDSHVTYRAASSLSSSPVKAQVAHVEVRPVARAVPRFQIDDDPFYSDDE